MNSDCRNKQFSGGRRGKTALGVKCPWKMTLVTHRCLDVLLGDSLHCP